MTIDLWIEIAIGILIFWAVWKTIPSNPNLDWKYFHSLILVTKVRGELESHNANAEDWKQEIKKLVPFHPDFNGSDDIFTENNSAAEENWTKWFHNDEIIEKKLMEDPQILGSNFKPLSVVNWENIADQADNLVKQTLRRRFEHAIIVGQGDFAKMVAESLALPLFSQALDIDALANVWKEKNQRFIFVGHGSECQEMLQFIHQFPAVRDRILTMVFVDGEFNQEWLEKHFTHEKMDAEANHAIPYILWSYVDTKDLQNWHSLPEPPESKSNWQSIEIIDLGPFPVALREYSTLMCQALCIVIAKRMELL